MRIGDRDHGISSAMKRQNMRGCGERRHTRHVHGVTKGELLTGDRNVTTLADEHERDTDRHAMSCHAMRTLTSMAVSVLESSVSRCSVLCVPCLCLCVLCARLRVLCVCVCDHAFPLEASSLLTFRELLWREPYTTRHLVATCNTDTETETTYTIVRATRAMTRAHHNMASQQQPLGWLVASPFRSRSRSRSRSPYRIH